MSDVREGEHSKVRLPLNGAIRVVGRTGSSIVARTVEADDVDRLVVIDVRDGATTLAPSAGGLVSVCEKYLASAGGDRLAIHHPDGSLVKASAFGDRRRILWIVATDHALWVLSSRGFDKTMVGLDGDIPAVLHDLEISSFDPDNGEMVHHFELDRPDATVLDARDGPSGCRLQRIRTPQGDAVVLVQSQDRTDGQANQRVLYFAHDSNFYRLLGQTRPRVRGRSGLYQVVVAGDNLLTAGYRDLATRDLEWLRDGDQLRPFTDWPVARTLRRLKKGGTWIDTRHPVHLAAVDSKLGTEVLSFDPRSLAITSLGEFEGSIRPVTVPVPGTDRQTFLRPLSVDDDDGCWLTLDTATGTTVVGVSATGKVLASQSHRPKAIGLGVHDGQVATVIPNSGGADLEWTPV